MKKFNQILSLTLSSALALTSVPWPASAAGPVAAMPAFAQAFAPLESLGYVASSYSPATQTERPRLIVISDLHAHLEVQHHIVDMLDGLVSKLTTGPQAQKQVQIFVEGGWENHLEHPLSSIKNPKLRSIMADYFLEKAEIPATQAFSERYPTATNFTLTGVENKDEYQANRGRFLESYPTRKRLLSALARHENSLKQLSSSVEGRAYQKLQDMRQGYLSGTLSGDRYARSLLHQASRFHMANRYVELLQQPNASNNPQFDLALSEVNRLVSSKLSESRPFAAFFRGDEKTVRQNIATVDAYLDLLKRTLSDQLTPEEVPFAYARLPQMAQVAKILLADEALDIDLNAALEKALAFYPFAFMRNDSLVENSLAALQKSGSTDTGVLVAGGFHSEAISQYLRNHQIPYILINPTVSRDLSTIEQLNYVERMAGTHVTPQEAKADFNHSWDRSVVSRSAGTVAPISDIIEPAGNANTMAPVVGQVANAVGPQVLGAPEVSPQKPGSKTSDDKTDPNKSGNGSTPALYRGGRVMGALTAGLLAGVMSFNPAGLTLAPLATNAVSEEQNLSRVDAVRRIVTANRVPVKAQMTETQGATFDLEGKSFKGSGPLATLFSPLLDSVLNTARNSVAPTRVHVQGIDGNAFLNFSVLGENYKEDAPFITVGAGTPEQVIFFNTDRLPALQQGLEAAKALAEGKTLSPELAQAATAMDALMEEFSHAVTGQTFTGEAQVQALAGLSMVRLVASMATKDGAEAVGTAGLDATRIPQKALEATMNWMHSNSGAVVGYWGNSGAQKSAAGLGWFARLLLRIQVKLSAYQNEGMVNLQAFENTFMDLVNPSQAHAKAQKELAAEVDSLKARLAQELPTATPYEVEQATQAAMPYVALGFPVGSPKYKIAIRILRQLLKNQETVGNQA